MSMEETQNQNAGQMENGAKIEPVIRKDRQLKYTGNILKIYEDTVIANGHEAHWDYIHHESCLYYEYDEDYECYVCEVNLDEDEMARFMEDRFYDCPYYRLGDEYMIVRKQM